MKIRRKKLFIVEIVALIFLLCGLMAVWKGIGTSNKKTEIKIDEYLTIKEVGEYSGAFMEDGTDEAVENVMMIVVENKGDKVLQYAELSLPLGDEIAEFAFSTLEPGEQMVVLEKNRMKCPKKKDITDVNLNHVVYFDETPDMHEDVIKVSTLEGALNIENISGKDITGPVAVYYKNVEDGIYHGGITYRALVKEGLKAGEIRQVMTNHFSLENSEIMFVTYVP